MLDEEPRQALTMLRVVCGALMAGIALLGMVVAYLVAGTGFELAGGEVPGILLPLAGLLTLGSLLSAPFAEGILSKVPPGTPRDVAMQRFQGAVIVGFALREGAGLFALVAGLLAGNLVWGLGLAGLALLGMLLAWPSEEKVRAQLKAVGG